MCDWCAGLCLRGLFRSSAVWRLGEQSGWCHAWGNVAVDFLSGRLSVDGRIFAQMQRRVGRVSSLWTRIELVSAPVVEHIASTLAVFAAPAPVMEHISSSCSNHGTCAGDGIRRTNSCSDRSTCVNGGVTAITRALIAARASAVEYTAPTSAGDRSTCASGGQNLHLDRGGTGQRPRLSPSVGGRCSAGFISVRSAWCRRYVWRHRASSCCEQ